MSPAGAVGVPGRARGALALWLAVAVALGLVLAACSGDDGDGGGEAAPTTEPAGPPATLPPVPTLEPLEPGVLRVGVVGLGTLDPAQVSPAVFGELLAADLLYEGLTVWDSITGTLVPGVASEWSANDESTEWTFTLDPDARFADGSPVTADDVVASLNRLVAGGAEINGRRLEAVVGHDDVVAGDSDALAGVEALDEATVVVRTDGPSASLPILLSAPTYGIVPAVTPIEPQADIAGSGAFRLVDNDWRTVRFEAVDGADVAVDAVEMVVFDTEDEVQEAYDEGLLDLAMIDPELVPGATEIVAETTGGDPVVMVPLPATVFFAFDLRHPVTEDLRLRQAVSLAVDRDELLSGVLAGNLPLHGVLPFGVAGAAAEPCEMCVYDPDRARALVEEMFADGDVPLVVVDTYDAPAEQALGETLVAALEDVGLAASLRVRPFEEYQQQVIADPGGGGAEAPEDPPETAEPADVAPGVARDRQVFLFAWAAVGGDGEASLGPMFVTGAPDNVTGLDDSMVDLVLLAAREATDPTQRAELLADAERAVMGAVPVVPLATLAAPLAVGERVEGLLPRPDGTLVMGLVRLSD
ncbi:MAG: ABC transporter substrate-binding protein [Acidimicrobiia bacterium]|nr:ABC transporter substrate-binding protein [Acidimicrobiia bacterium]